MIKKNPRRLLRRSLEPEALSALQAAANMRHPSQIKLLLPHHDPFFFLSHHEYSLITFIFNVIIRARSWFIICYSYTQFASTIRFCHNRCLRNGMNANKEKSGYPHATTIHLFSSSWFTLSACQHVKWWSTIKWSTKPAQLSSLPRSQQHILEQCYPPQSSPRVWCRGRPSPRPWSRPGQLGAARRRVGLPALEPGNADGNRAGSQGMLQGNPSPKMARFYFLDCPSLLGHVPRVQCQTTVQSMMWLKKLGNQRVRADLQGFAWLCQFDPQL